MVSLWPWKGEDNSPASFEKALSALATKISKSQSQLKDLQQRGRRIEALWTLYTSFAYLLCVIILFLVVGWRSWTALEYTTVAGSPVAIWLIRTGITAYYNFRVDSITQRLEAQQAERVKTIEKLKASTKYDSTQQLLEKYGGAPPKPKVEKKSTPSKVAKSAPKQPSRVSLGPPPPTANIQRPNQVPNPPPIAQADHKLLVPYAHPPPATADPRAEFAPNAFPAAPPQYTNSETANHGHWYDRILDVLLGEDETASKNRMVLICQNCRLVNGQAPPGTKTLADLGKWRCFGCGTMNGEEDEAAKAVEEIKLLIKEKGEGSVSASEGKSELEHGEAENGDLKEDNSGIEPDVVEQDTTEQDVAEEDTTEQDIVQQDATEAGVVEQDATEQDAPEENATEKDIAEQDVIAQGTASGSDAVEAKPSKGKRKSSRRKAQ